MKHIRQCSYKHTSGSLDVAEDVSGFMPVIDHRAILAFPFDDSFKELITVCQCVNPGNLMEYLPQLTGVGSLREATAPGQPLALNVDQAPLNCDFRPELPEYLYHVGITVHRKARWLQSSRNQVFKEQFQLRLRALRDTVFPCYKRMGTSIHQGHETVWTMKESTVKDKMPILPQAQYWRWHPFFQLVIYHTVELSQAVFTLICQLSRGVTFNNPKPEPFILLPICSLSTPPAGPAARRTQPALFPFGISTIFPEAI